VIGLTVVPVVVADYPGPVVFLLLMLMVELHIKKERIIFNGMLLFLFGVLKMQTVFTLTHLAKAWDK
jgi:hypothetical protein